MKKVFMLLVIILLVGCTKETNVIKEDYEKDNDKLLKVNIVDNKIEKIKIEELKNNMNKNGIVYFCSPKSNYCRNNIEILIELVNDLGIKTYYVDITDIKDSNEYKEFVESYKEYIKEDILDGDVLVFSYNKVMDYLTIDPTGKDYSKKISEEERKLEYKRLYDSISILLDPEACEQDTTGC